MAIRVASVVVWSRPPKPNRSAWRASSLRPVAMTKSAAAATMQTATIAQTAASIALDVAVDCRDPTIALTGASAGS
jgi:hypothetical protein